MELEPDAVVAVDTGRCDDSAGLPPEPARAHAAAVVDRPRSVAVPLPMARARNRPRRRGRLGRRAPLRRSPRPSGRSASARLPTPRTCQAVTIAFIRPSRAWNCLEERRDARPSSSPRRSSATSSSARSLAGRGRAQGISVPLDITGGEEALDASARRRTGSAATLSASCSGVTEPLTRSATMRSPSVGVARSDPSATTPSAPLTSSAELRRGQARSMPSSAAHASSWSASGVASHDPGKGPGKISPLLPSIVISSPTANERSPISTASLAGPTADAPTTAGMPQPRATTAAWLASPPRAVSTPADAGHAANVLG